MDEKEIGLKIKQLRSEYSLKIGEKFTQEKLAKKLDISRGYLSDIESGRTKPSDYLLQRIAFACDAEVSRLIGESHKYFINYEKLKQLRKRKQLTQKELNLLLNFDDENVIGRIERVESAVDDELLNKLSLFFYVSKEFLISRDEITKCPICKTNYCPLIKSDYYDHEVIHDNFVKSGIKDIYIEYDEQEKVKEECRNIISSKETSLIDKYNSSIKYFQCYYSRSMRVSEFSSRHVSFKEFISMLLNQKRGVCSKLPDDLLSILIKQFGKKEGIPDGESYAPLKEVIQVNKEQLEFWEKYDCLDDKGKHTVDTVLDIEFKRYKDEL